MKILLDECVTKKLKKRLIEHDLETDHVTEVGLTGTKNGKLLAATEKMGYDALLTTDKSMKYQQKISHFSLMLIVFRAVDARVSFLLPLIPKMLARLPFMEKGRTYTFDEKD